ncbi:hypothetical protein JZ751_013146 [Albula glossodonta]|uniref:Uncharacterized protein n=1 Tax=Albula glossodonta TaxID=121402 RepID=A0A8T2NTT7_9TELE|nr:hypothetical protein JZ751_013146 [Albula glossodonta]
MWRSSYNDLWGTITDCVVELWEPAAALAKLQRGGSGDKFGTAIPGTHTHPPGARDAAATVFTSPTAGGRTEPPSAVRLMRL